MGLTIGTIPIDPPVVLAPMAGVTGRTYRTLCREAGAGLCVTEMVHARALVERNAKTLTMIRFDEGAVARSVQLYAVAPGSAGAAARLLVGEFGVEHIDLNFGCPAAKVTRRGGGAALPVQPGLLRAVIASVVAAAGAVPVTVKMRLGLDGDHPTAAESARIAREEGVVAVALHARTAEQLYSGRADWSAIARLKETLEGIPVLGNGDIWTPEDAVRMVAETGCDGVVIGRGALGRPWFFRDLADVLAGRPRRPAPALGEVLLLMRRHLEGLCEDKQGDQAVRDFRKHVGWYLSGYGVPVEDRLALLAVGRPDELLGLLDRFDPAVPFDPAAYRERRGHRNGPYPVPVPAGWLDGPQAAASVADDGVLVSGG